MKKRSANKLKFKKATISAFENDKLKGGCSVLVRQTEICITRDEKCPTHDEQCNPA